MTTLNKNVLAVLESANLFGQVGVAVPPGENWISARSWLDAMAHCVGSKWSDTLIEGSNLLRENILALSKDRYQQWRTVDSKVRPLVLELARKKTAELMRSNGLPDKFMFSVFASLLGVALEAEYSDLVAPGFYTNVILDCYLKGHFPCGWEGEFPAGRLIVY